MNSINYYYLRPKKALDLKKIHNKQFVSRQDLKSYTFYDAVILPLKNYNDNSVAWGRGGVVDSDGKYVEESANDNLYYGNYPYESCEYSNDTVVYCGYFRHHWGDFIVDCSTRLYYFLKNKDTDEIDNYVFFVENEGNTEVGGNFKEFFELLGIWNKLLFINTPMKFKKVIIPENSYSRNKRYYSKQYLDIFGKIRDEALKSDIKEKPKKVFLTRSGLPKSQKMEFGTDMLDNFFKNNGYDIISPEKISLKEMINTLYYAQKTACISGTLPHNMLFIGSRELIIAERNCLNNIIQADINRMLDLKTTYIDVNITLYPVELAYGPFVFAFNNNLKKYADENGMRYCDDVYCSEKYKKHLFKKYILGYKTEHGLCLYMPDWMIERSSVIFEAYNDGEEYFYDYLKGKKYYKVSQYFSINNAKRIIKKILRR